MQIVIRTVLGVRSWRAFKMQSILAVDELENLFNLSCYITFYSELPERMGIFSRYEQVSIDSETVETVDVLIKIKTKSSNSLN